VVAASRQILVTPQDGATLGSDSGGEPRTHDEAYRRVTRDAFQSAMNPDGESNPTPQHDTRYRRDASWCRPPLEHTEDIHLIVRSGSSRQRMSSANLGPGR